MKHTGPQGYIGGKPLVAWWWTQLQAGMKHRDLLAHKSRWDTWRKYYRGQWDSKILPINIFFMMMRTIVPRTYFRNPSVSVVAAKPGIEYEALAKIVQRVDNKMLRTMKIKKQMKRIVQHAWMFGTGGGRLGFGGLYTPSPEVGKTGAPANLAGSSMGAWSPEYSGGIVDNMPWFRAVHPGRLIFPAELDDIEEARWVAIEIERPLQDVLSDKRLINLDALRDRSGGPKKQNEHSFSNDKNPIEMVKLYEVKDMQTKKVFIIAPERLTDKHLFMDDDRLQTANRPAVYPLVFNPDDEYIWGTPDSLILEPQQLELNELRTLSMKHRRMSIVKLLYQKGSITQGELAKVLSEDVMAGVGVDDLNAIKPLQIAEIPSTHIMWERELMQDVREVSGMSRNAMGAALNPGSADTTATEVNVVQQAGEIRLDERRDAIADMLMDMIADLNPLLFEHWSQEQVIDVIGPEGIPIWVKFTGDMLKRGTYEIKIDPDSSLPETKAIREQRAINLYDRLKTNPLIAPDKLTAHLLNEIQGTAFQDMMQGLNLGSAGLTPDNPLPVKDFAKLMSAAGQQQGQPSGPRAVPGGGAR